MERSELSKTMAFDNFIVVELLFWSPLGEIHDAITLEQSDTNIRRL